MKRWALRWPLATVAALLCTALIAGCGSGRPVADQPSSGHAPSSIGELTTESESTTVSPPTSSQPLLPDPVASAIERICAVVGLSAGAIELRRGEAELPAADSSLHWEGGFAEFDSATGRIVLISHTPASAAPSADPPPGYELTSRADALLALLGWDQAALDAGHFTSELRDDMTLSHTTAHRWSWVGHTSAGILNGSRIDLRLAHKDGTLLLFAFHAGAGEVPGDGSDAISREEAIKIAHDLIVERDLPRAQLQSDTPLKAGDLHLTTKEATLTWTNAPAVTDGETMLIWRTALVGTDPSGMTLGGVVYLEAVSGRVLQQQSY